MYFGYDGGDDGWWLDDNPMNNFRIQASGREAALCERKIAIFPSLLLLHTKGEGYVRRKITINILYYEKLFSTAIFV